MPGGFDVQVLRSVTEIDAAVWDRLNLSRPFSSHRWYRFGEQALTGDEPFYVLLFRHGELAARASFWLTRHEPIPISWTPVRHRLETIFRRWPLLICRTALANAPGVILPADESRFAALETITRLAHEFAHEQGASAVLFDYLSPGIIDHWPSDYTQSALSEPGTKLLLDGCDFETYLSRLSKSARKDYHRHINRAAELGIVVSCHSSATQVTDAVELIRSVEEHHQVSPNPHVQHVLEHMEMVGGSWLTAKMEGRLVGCGLLIGDEKTQFLTLLGLNYTVRYAYFRLLYAAIQRAIEIGVSDLRGGSGAYDLKERLGFVIENNNMVAFKVNNPALGWLARRLAESAEMIR